MLKQKQDKLPDGRKYRLAVIMMLVMLVGFGLAGLNPVMSALYPQLLTGLTAIYFTFCGGNIGSKWVTGKNGDLQISGGGQQKPPEDK